MDIYENERLDEVNDALRLIQKTDGLTFGTDALLLAAYVRGRYASGVELGGGTGIVSFLLLARGKLGRCECIELQEEYAELIERNARLNGLDGRMETVCGDVRHVRLLAEREMAFTNPPYMKASSGRENRELKKNLARHEVMGDINDFMEAARRSVKYGGDVYAVYRPDRLTDLIAAMRRAEIEPKRASFVHADVCSEPSLVLVEGRRGGKCGMRVTRPFIIYGDAEHRDYTEDMNYVLEKGSFPTEYEKR